MRILLFLVFFIYNVIHMDAQTPGEWAWMKGDSMSNPFGYYGVQGVPDPQNNPRGFYEAVEWTDLQGNFWLYGGVTITNYEFADLWMFNPSTNIWTWKNGNGFSITSPVYGIQGVPSVFNNPGCRSWGTASWVDAAGDLWLFGGSNSSATGIKNDLWRYHIATNEWTFMKGDQGGNSTGNYGVVGIEDTANLPAARQEMNATWVDNNNNLWVFGGADLFTNSLNDLWKYNLSTNNWTWMKGSNLLNDTGSYGSLGIPSPLNCPHSREAYGKWKDRSGNFWLFGGFYRNQTILYDDVWKYDIATNNWTWMAGGNNSNSPSPNYISTCSVLANQDPGARAENRACWTDACGKFWFYGGFTYADLWKFDPDLLTWTWVSGTNQSNQFPNYGTLGVSSPSNYPGTKRGALPWLDLQGNFWLFGGEGYNGMRFNDMWRFVPDTNCAGCNSATVPANANFLLMNNTICVNTCLNFINHSQHATNFQWHFPGGVPAVDTVLNPQNICYGVAGNYDVTLIASNSFSSDTLTLHNYVTVIQTPQSDFTASDSTLCVGDCINFSDSSMNNPSNWAWNFNGGSPVSSNIQNPGNICYNSAGNFSVTLAVSKNGCTDSRTKFQFIHVVPCNIPSVNFQASDSDICVGTCINYFNYSQHATNFQWYFQGGIPAVDTAMNPQNICYGVAGNYDVTLVASNNIYSDTLTLHNYVSVTQPPQANFTVSDSTLCVGDCISFSDLSSNTPSGWSWNFNGGSPASSNIQNPGNICYNSSGNFSIELAVSKNGCSDSITKLQLIHVIPCNIPSVNFQASDTTICAGTCVDFTNLSQNANAYHWIFQGATNPSDTRANPQNICYDSAGNFNVTLIATNNIGSDTTIFHNYISVYPSPPVFSISQFNDTLFAPQGFQYYQWYYNSNVLIGANNYFNTSIQNGYHAVSVININGCQETVSLKIGNDTCLYDPMIPNVFTPNNDGLNDLYKIDSLCLGTEFRFVVYNRWGMKIYSSSDANFQWNGTSESGKELPSGQYYYLLNNNNREYHGIIELIRK